MKKIYLKSIITIISLYFLNIPGFCTPIFVHKFVTNFFSNPIGITCDSLGNIYISDSIITLDTLGSISAINSNIYRFDSTGNNRTPFLTSDESRFLGIAAAKHTDGKDTLYLTESQGLLNSTSYSVKGYRIEDKFLALNTIPHTYQMPLSITIKTENDFADSIYLATQNNEIGIYKLGSGNQQSIQLGNGVNATGLSYNSLSNYLWAALRDQNKVKIIGQNHEIVSQNPLSSVVTLNTNDFGPLWLTDRTQGNIQSYQYNLNTSLYSFYKESQPNSLMFPNAITLNEKTGQIIVLDEGGNAYIYHSGLAWIKSGFAILQDLPLVDNLLLDSALFLPNVPDLVNRRLRVSTIYDAISNSPIGGNGILSVTGPLNSLSTATLLLQDTDNDGLTRLEADKIQLNTRGILSFEGGKFLIKDSLSFNGGTIKAHTDETIQLTNQAGSITVTDNHGTIDVDENIIFQILTPIVKTGANIGKLIKQGLGELQLTKLYNGSMDIESGIVSVSEGNDIGEINTNLDKITLGTNNTSGTLKFLNPTPLNPRNIGVFHEIVLNAGGGIFDVAANTTAAPSDISGDGSLTKIGLGSLSLVSNTSYKKGTFLNEGILQIGTDNALPTPLALVDPLFPFQGDLAIETNGTLDLSIYNQTIKKLSGNGLITSSAYNSSYLSTLTLTPDTDTTFAGKIQDGTGKVAVVINSPGVTQTFSGVNPFSGGLTVTAGMVAVAPTSLDPSDPVLGTGNITMQDNTALYWNSNATLNNTFTLNPGNPNNQGITMDTDGNTGILGQAITVLGKLIKKGMGELKLLAGGQNSGTLDIQEGTFTTEGDLTNNVGATLANSGTFKNVNHLFTNRGSLTGNGSFLLKGGIFQDLNNAIVGWLISIDSLGSTIISGDQAHPNNVLTLNNTITDNGPLNPGLLTFSGPGTIVLNEENDYNGGTLISNAAIVQVGHNSALGTGVVSLEAGTLQAGQDALTLNNDISLGNSSIIDNKGYTFNFSGDFSSSEEGELKFIDSSVAQNGTTTLSGQSTFTKKLIAQSTRFTNAGVIILNNSTILENDNPFTNTGTINIDESSISNKSTFINSGEITNNDRFYNFETLSLEANSKFTGTGSLNLSGSTVIFNGPGIQFNNNIAINPDFINSLGVTLFVANGVTQNISNVISSPNGSVPLTKDGLGKLILNGANTTHSGQTTLSLGALQVGHNAALGTNSLKMLNNTTLQFGIGGLVINNPLVLDSGNSVNPGVATIDTGNFMSTLSNAITQIGNSVMKLIIQGGNVLTLNGLISHEGMTELGVGTTLKAGISNIFAGVNKSLKLAGAGSTFDMTTADQTLGELQSNISTSQVLLNTRTLTINQPSTFDGVFSGVGGSIIAKADLTLGGQSTNTGLFTIDASVNPVTMTMKVNSSLAEGSSLSLIGSGANSAVFDMKLAYQTISELNGNAQSLIELGNQNLTFGINNDSIFKGEIQGTNVSSLVKKGNGTANFEGISPNFHGITSVVTGGLVLKNLLSIGTGVLEIETPDSPSIGNSGFVTLDFSGQANQHTNFSNSVKGTGELNVVGSYIDITGDNSDFEGFLHIGGSVYVTEQQNLGQSTINLTGLLGLNPQGDFIFNNRLIAPLTGSLVVSMETPQNIFKFDDIHHGFPSQFEGEVVLEQGAFDITGRNTEALTSGTLNLSSYGTAFLGGDPGNPMTQAIGGLTFSGGMLSLRPSGDDITPADTLAVNMLDLSSSLNGTIQITIPAGFDPPENWDGHNKPLLMQDDVILSQFVRANQVNRSNVSNSLRLVDQDENIVSAEREIDIDEGTQRVAKGFYDYGILVQDDGLYLSYGLQKLELQNQQTTVLGGDHQGQGAAEFHAQLTGQGNIEIDATNSITLNNPTNNYQGTTTVKTGELILGSDHSLGDTSDLILKEETRTNLFGTTQTVGALHTEARSSLNFNGGNLTVEQGGVVQPESLSGSGILNVQGGSFQVNGPNQTFSATTRIENGAEVVLSDSHGLGTSTVENNGHLTLQGNGNSIDNAFNNNISGVGTLIIQNADIVLGGNNQHTDGTEIKNSIVSIMSDSNLGDAAGEVKLDDSTLQFNDSVTLPGTRILTLNNTSVIDTQNYSSSINGEINGVGILTKKGVNRLSINGDKNFAGDINVVSGELKVNGDISNANVNLEEGSTFSGNNTVLNLINRGIVAPGNSIGQIQVRNIFNNTGGIYQCEVNDAGQSDLIRVLGATTLHGILQVIPMAGNYQLNQPYIYTILTSANPINTTFDTVNGMSPLFEYHVIYNPNDVQLRLIRTSTINQVITEGNAGVVSQNLEKIGNLTGTLQTATNSLMGFNKNQIIDALNRFNTASNTLLADNLADNFFDLGNTLSHMLHSPLERSAPHSSFKELVKSISSNFKATMAQLFSSSAKRSSMNQTTKSNGQQIPHSFRSKVGQSTVWSYSDAKVLNQKSYTSPGTYLPSLKSTMGETKLGFDHQFTDQILVGFMAGYGNTSYKLSDHYGDGKINSYHVGSYSSIHITPELYIDTLVSYGINNLKGTRKINFSGFEAQASQKHHAHQFGGLIETGYEIYLPSNYTLTPMVGIGILSLKEEGYREIGADTLGLNVRRQRRTYIQHKFGAQLARHFIMDETQFYGFIRGSYTHRRGLKNAHRVTSSFIGQLPSFTVFGDKKNHSFFSPGAGLTALFKNDVYISIGYNGDLGKKQKSHEGFFKIGYKF